MKEKSDIMMTRYLRGNNLVQFSFFRQRHLEHFANLKGNLSRRIPPTT